MVGDSVRVAYPTPGAVQGGGAQRCLGPTRACPPQSLHSCTLEGQRTSNYEGDKDGVNPHCRDEETKHGKVDK